MKKLTINEIAERAGVSKTTVSFYLNGKINKMSEETKQRIQHIIDETGYEPSAAARAMKAKSSGVVGSYWRTRRRDTAPGPSKELRRLPAPWNTRLWWETAVWPSSTRRITWNACSGWELTVL